MVNKPFYIYADASEYGFGSVLIQENQIIGLHSGKFKSHQLKYTVGEKELYSIIQCIKFFHKVLYASEIIVYTDHKNLLSGKLENSRLERWKVLLQEYDVIFKHVQGVNNSLADFLSREFGVKTKINTIKNVNEKIIKNKISEKLKMLKKFFKQKNCEKTNIFEKKLVELHKELGHIGAEKLLHILEDSGRNKNTRRLVEKITRECKRCRTHKKGSNKTPGKFYSHLKADKPFEIVCIDILGPLDVSQFKHSFKTDKINLLCMTDVYTRFTEVEPIENLSSQVVTAAFKKCWLKQNPCPKVVITDQGRQFISKEFKKLLRKKKIKHKTTSAYNPAENGIVERTNGKILNAIRTYNGSSFKNCLNIIWQSVNLQKVRTTGFSPYEIKNKKTFLGTDLISKEIITKYHNN